MVIAFGPKNLLWTCNEIYEIDLYFSGPAGHSNRQPQCLYEIVSSSISLYVDEMFSQYQCFQSAVVAVGDKYCYCYSLYLIILHIFYILLSYIGASYTERSFRSRWNGLKIYKSLLSILKIVTSGNFMVR